MPEPEVIEDGREPVELLSRVIAHVFHRTPVLRRVEKRLEGEDSGSGLGSDFSALLATLYYRNREAFSAVGDDLKRRVAQQRSAKSAGNNGMSPSPVPGEVDLTVQP